MEEMQGNEDVLLLNSRYSDLFFKRRTKVALLLMGMIVIGSYSLIILMYLFDSDKSQYLWDSLLPLFVLLAIVWGISFGLGFIGFYFMRRKLKGCHLKLYQDRLIRMTGKRSEIHYYKDLTKMKCTKSPNGEIVSIHLKLKKKNILFHGFDEMESIEKIIKEKKPAECELKEKVWRFNYQMPYWSCIFFVGALGLYVPFILWGIEKLQYALIIVKLGLIGYFLIKRPFKRSMNKHYGWLDFVIIGLWALSIYFQIKSML